MRLTSEQVKKMKHRGKDCTNHEFEKCDDCSVIYCVTCNPKDKPEQLDCPYCDMNK